MIFFQQHAKLSQELIHMLYYRYEIYFLILLVNFWVSFLFLVQIEEKMIDYYDSYMCY